MSYPDNSGFYGSYNDRGTGKPYTFVGPGTDAAANNAGSALKRTGTKALQAAQASLAQMPGPPQSMGADAGMQSGPLQPASPPGSPYTFIGPSADAAMIKAGRGALDIAKSSLAQTPPQSMGAESGMQSGPNILPRTAKGYPNVGWSTSSNTPAVGGSQGPKQEQGNWSIPTPQAQLLNLPFNTGLPIETGVPNPSPIPSGGNATGGIPDSLKPESVQDYLLRNQKQPGDPLSSPENVPGQRVAATNANNLPRPGSTVLNLGDQTRPGEYQTNAERLAQFGKGMTGTVTDKNTGLSFTGSAEDAAKFFAPVGKPSRVTPQASNALMTPPQYLGPESGIGWKTRRDMYRSQMDAYNKATGNQNEMDIAKMKEFGAGVRAMMSAENDAERNRIARESLVESQTTGKLDRQVKQLGLDNATDVRALQKKYKEATDPEERRMIADQLRVLSNKDQAKFQVVTKKAIDPKTNLPTETNYAVNPDDPGRSFEIGAGGQQGQYGPPPKNMKIGVPDPTTYRAATGQLVQWDGKGWKIVNR